MECNVQRGEINRSAHKPKRVSWQRQCVSVQMSKLQLNRLTITWWQNGLKRLAESWWHCSWQRKADSYNYKMLHVYCGEPLCLLAGSLKSQIKFICGNKMPTRFNRWFVLQILLLAQNVSDTTLSFIRSSIVLYRWLLPVVFGALVLKLSVWCGAERYMSGLRDTIPTTLKPKHQIPQAVTSCIILSSSWWWA
jgi:hypothetical protein